MPLPPHFPGPRPAPDRRQYEHYDGGEPSGDSQSYCPGPALVRATYHRRSRQYLATRWNAWPVTTLPSRADEAGSAKSSVNRKSDEPHRLAAVVAWRPAYRDPNELA